MPHEMMRYGNPHEASVEYVKRTAPFSMTTNHYHAYYEVYYLFAGQREYFIKDSSYSVQQGDMIFIPKYELHKTLQAGEASHERVVIHFGDAFIRAVSGIHADFLLQPFLQTPHLLRLPEPEKSVIRDLIARMIGELRGRQTAYEINLSHLIVLLMVTAARLMKEKGELADVHSNPVHERILEIVRYLNGNYTEPIKLDALAAKFAVSPYYLSRTFKKVTGFTLIDYLNQMRVKEAQKLLETTEMKILEVSAAAGFENFSHFGKMFKRIASCTPKAYRKHHKK